MIEILKLTKKVPNRIHPILDNISCTIPEKKLTAIMGLNGSGKTTLLQCIAKTLKAESGTISFDGKNIDSLSTKQLSQKIA